MRPSALKLRRLRENSRSTQFLAGRTKSNVRELKGARTKKETHWEGEGSAAVKNLNDQDDSFTQRGGR